MTSADGSAGVEATQGRVALYHVMRAGEGFDETAEMLFSIVREAAGTHPGRPRALFLDVEGHRLRRNGPYDHDAFEIMSSFLLGFLAPWLTEIVTPLGRVEKLGAQSDDLPDHLLTLEAAEGVEQARELSERTGVTIFHADTGEWISEDREGPRGRGEES